MKVAHLLLLLIRKRHRGRFIVSWLAIIWRMCATIVPTPAEGMPLPVGAGSQERVAELIQMVLGAYRDESTLQNGLTNNSSTNYTNIEAKFREASLLMPARLDLRFGIASALLGQALQTNSQFRAKMSDALKVYAEIHALDRNGFQAAILAAAYSQAIGENDASRSILVQLMAVQPQRTSAYRQKFHRIEKILKIVPNTDSHKAIQADPNSAIVVLGAALGTNGTMKTKLVDRLEQGLILAKLCPEAPIMVTGGNQMNGVTEAHAMRLWFMNKGVSTSRIYLEDQARDTVGNAIYSCRLLQKLGIKKVTLVTSESHMRRALADFEEASLEQGLMLEFSHLVSPDEPILDEERERVAIYRDVMRTSGLWAFPGVQR
jgi:uncharacterized SAM-binding protein YcdF (DUF218 family)